MGTPTLYAAAISSPAMYDEPEGSGLSLSTCRIPGLLREPGAGISSWGLFATHWPRGRGGGFRYHPLRGGARRRNPDPGRLNLTGINRNALHLW